MPLLLLILLLISTPVWAATRYVSTTGSDTNTCSASTSPSTPKRNIMGVNGGLACMGAGDTLYLRGGTYAEAIWSASQTLPTGTSWSNAITIASYPNETATLRPTTTSTAIALMHAYVKYLIFDRITVDGNGLTTYGGEDTPNNHALEIGEDAHHVRFQNGEMFGAYGPYIMLSGSQATGTYAGYNEILHNRLHDAKRSYGLYINSQNNLVEGNEIYNNAGYGLQAYGYTPNGTGNLIIRNNKFYGNGFVRGYGAMVLSSGTNIQAYNNLIYNNLRSIDLNYDCIDCKVYNNTLVGNYLSIDIATAVINADIRNNILFQTGTIQNAGSGTTFASNLCSGSGTGCEIIGDPGFVNAVGGDYHLALVSSPAVGAGVNLSSIFTTDADGFTRPASDPWAIGAYEFNPSSPSSNRLGLHVTTDELAIWNQRIVAGTPYQSDWTRILGRADTFVATPTGTWTGNQLGVAWNGAAVVAGTQPPNVMPDGGNGGDRTTGDFVRDAGFVYAVTGTTSYRDAVLTLLLTQAAIAGTDFANTTKWATTYTDASEDFEISIWLRKLVYAYSYIRPSISSVDQATLDAWFNVAGTYWALVLQNVTATRFPNRLSDDYATVSFSCVKPVGGSSAVTHFGGYAIDQFGFPWNNKRMNFAAMIAAVGATTANSTLKSDAKRMFKEWLRSNIFPDGTSWEQARWTTGNPQSGFNYAWTTIGSASTIADHLARTGDTELYEYSTSEGNCGSEGGPKSLHQILQRYANITLGNTLVYASLTSTSDPNLLIDSSGPGGTLYNDVNLAQPNVYYRDTLLTSSYTRTMPSSWNAGGYDGFGGDWGHLPAARFMFGQMEGLVWPYATTTPDYRLQSTSPLRNAALCLASVPLDIVGYTRGSSCDMGAYEFQSGEATGTVAKYLFSEGSGITVADSSGRGHTGTFAPDAGWTTGWIGPYAGLFDGTRYVSISGMNELRPTTEATVGVWFKATTTDVAGSSLVALPNDGLMPYLTSLGRAACQLYDELDNLVNITSSGSYLDDARHFLSCSYLKGDGLYLRVDHTQVGFTSLSTNINYTMGGTNNVELGRSSADTTNLNFVGSLDHITLKDTACDTACDLALFQEGMSQRRIMVMGVR